MTRRLLAAHPVGSLAPLLLLAFLTLSAAASTAQEHPPPPGAIPDSAPGDSLAPAESTPAATAHADSGRTENALETDQGAPAGADEHGEPGEPGGHDDPVGKLPLWTTIPFAGILLSIALFPLLAPHFWHRNFPKVSAFWALLFAVPFLVALRGDAVQAILHIYLIDYIPFIILLWTLFTIAGGIYVGGTLRGSPGVNVVLLLIGTFLASWIGTTGAAMVMIRPVLRANAWRVRRAHVVVFFIFLVANIGGSLTPLGDPPLFLGFLHNVPFFWVTTSLLRPMLFVVAVLIVIFFVVDRWFYKREEQAEQPAAGRTTGVRIEGLHNLVFLAGVMGGVIFSGFVRLAPWPVYGHIELQPQNVIRDGWLILMGLLSLLTTRAATRQQNEFSWFPIKEVAYLFAGIFMTIIPALAILKAGSTGALASLTEAVHGPVRFFWATGVLSSFLDNAPTYLTFFNAALGDLGVGESAIPGLLGFLGEAARNHEFVMDLTAISAGAVFMGANTYIGNAPNFMVKSIAEEAGVPMPSFFGYMVKYSLPLLIPAFVLVTLVFFA
jgi:Na+/H+ antiporter NhaD/arsenite permease-like protein